jgi:uncharacterized protein (UPF0128 family)
MRRRTESMKITYEIIRGIESDIEGIIQHQTKNTQLHVRLRTSRGEAHLDVSYTEDANRRL